MEVLPRFELDRWNCYSFGVVSPVGTSVFTGIVNFVRRTTRIVKRTLRVQKTVREGPGARFPPGEEAGRGTETRRDN